MAEWETTVVKKVGIVNIRKGSGQSEGKWFVDFSTEMNELIKSAELTAEDVAAIKQLLQKYLTQ